MSPRALFSFVLAVNPQALRTVAQNVSVAAPIDESLDNAPVCATHC